MKIPDIIPIADLRPTSEAALLGWGNCRAGCATLMLRHLRRRNCIEV
jgi:hypothetical protein